MNAATTVNAQFDSVPQTYTWIGGFAGSWIVPTNWSPTRLVPLAGDSLVFNGGGPSGTNILINSVTNENLVQLQIISGAQVELQPALASTNFAISTSLDMASATGLTLSGQNNFSFTLKFSFHHQQS